MELTRKQEEGLSIALERYELGCAYTCISGFAGTGKTTLVSHIIAALDLDPQTDVAYVAYTGKAAKVLSAKGNPNATTIHKLIYRSRQMPNGAYYYQLRDSLEHDYKVIVVDEVSMVPNKMWNELLLFGVYIIACGDPGQLPPVSKDEANGILEHPHVFLDEIMRQAQESEIIRLTMDIREGKTIHPFKGNEVHIIKKTDLVSGMYTWADQILVGTNNQRININNQVREILGRGEEPEIGDKVISLHNQWDYLSDTDAPLTNGSIGTLKSFTKSNLWLPMRIKEGAVGILNAEIEEDADQGIFSEIPIDYQCLISGTPSLTPRQEYQLSKSKAYDGPKPMPFAYAYAITGHKSQGSEWNKVLVIEETFPFDREEHKRWLYTACTRASEKLVLVLKG